MDEQRSGYERAAAEGVLATVNEAVRVASCRYFVRTGAFAAALRESLGIALPEPLRAVLVPAGDAVLAWRSPTETLLLGASAAQLARLAQQLAAAADGCLIDLTGGLKAVRVSGPRIAELLSRLGSTASVPEPGESRRSRMADVPVVAVSVRAGEALLVVDRVYLPHLLAWIRETLLDFAPA